MSQAAMDLVQVLDRRPTRSMRQCDLVVLCVDSQMYNSAAYIIEVTVSPVALGAYLQLLGPALVTGEGGRAVQLYTAVALATS